MKKPRLTIHPARSHEEFEDAIRMFLAKGGSITVLEPKSTAYPIGWSAQYELDELFPGLGLGIPSEFGES